LPSPVDSLRKSSSAKKSIESSVKQETKPTVVVEQKTLSTPTGNVAHSHISIKKVLEDQKKQGELVPEKELPRDFVVLEQFKMYWKQFAYQLKDNGMETFHHALIKRDPLVINDELYAIVVDNQVQVDYIQPLLGDFISFLRDKVNNFSLEVKLQISDNPDEEVKYLTGKDKFAAMARKNPNLHVLKSLFNLDIDY
jgi:DNA polymerase-3 subunit gamma/tau